MGCEKRGVRRRRRGREVRLGACVFFLGEVEEGGDVTDFEMQLVKA